MTIINVDTNVIASAKYANSFSILLFFNMANNPNEYVIARTEVAMTNPLFVFLVTLFSKYLFPQTLFL